MAVIKDRYQLEVDTRGAQSNLTALQGSLKGLGFVAAGAAAIQFGRQIIDATRQFETYNNQLRLITNSQEELVDLTNRLSVAARQNRAAYGDTVDLFTKLTLATGDLGISQERVLTVTQKFQQALAISGADANTAAGAIRQFGQAMASGTVRGDEFVSIVEALGPALAIMAQESGLTVGKLRQMSQAGELTAETFFKMVEESKALSAAFNQTEETIGQLETALGDSFDRMLVKIGEVTGATTFYKDQVRELSRAFDFIAGTELAPVNLDIDQLRNFEETGISAAAALEELNNRLEYVSITGDELGFIFRKDAREFQALTAAIEEINEKLAEYNKIAEETKAETDALKEQEAALKAILEPHQKFIDQAQKFAETDYRTELEKANQRLIDAEIVLEQLHLAFERSNGQIENFTGLLKGAQNEIDAARSRVADLRNEAAALAEEDSFTKFFNDLVEGSRASVTEQTNAMLAQQELKDALADGKINVDIYAQAMERLNNILGISTSDTRNLVDAQKDLEEQINSVIDATNLRVQAAEDEALLEGLSGLDRQLKEIEISELRIAEAARKRVLAQAQEAGLDTSAIQDDLARINAARDEAIARQQELATAQYEQQRAFSTGWKNAFEEYVDEATNAAKQGERLFQTMSRGIEDAFVSFAKTGKFEVKDLLATIAEEILRSGIRRLVAQLFGNSLFGGGGNNPLFAGGFANGGMIPSGQFGLVGERGPELISGPAQITPLNNIGGGGVTNVSYNINAVDASSFKAMIARDPAFLHAVAEKGRRSVPQTRR